MTRKPIGTAPMTAAERQRRRREKLKPISDNTLKLAIATIEQHRIDLRRGLGDHSDHITATTTNEEIEDNAMTALIPRCIAYRDALAALAELQNALPPEVK